MSASVVANRKAAGEARKAEEHRSRTRRRVSTVLLAVCWLLSACGLIGAGAVLQKCCLFMIALMAVAIVVLWLYFLVN